jgi:single-stranded DNA-binding protein
MLSLVREVKLDVKNLRCLGFVMNKFICIGYLGSDPEVITNGCKLSLCIKTWDGKKDKNIWVKTFVFGTSASNCLSHLIKGRKVAIEGRLDYTVNGNTVIVTDNVQFL